MTTREQARKASSLYAMGLALAVTACGDDGDAKKSHSGGSITDAGSDGSMRDGAEAAPNTPDASDSGTDHRAAFGKGTRLEPIFLTDGKGATVFSHFIDHGRGDAECMFRIVHDENEKPHILCVENDVWAPLQSYRDAACSEPIIWADDEPMEGDVVTVNLPGACGYVQRLYRVGKALTLTTSYGSDVPGECSERELYGTPHAITPVSLEDYVEADRVQTPEDAAKDFSVTYLEGRDGSHQVTVGAIGETPCTGRKQPGTDDYYCIPLEGATLVPDTFADATCSAPVALRASASPECSGPATVIYGRSPSNEISKLYALGDAVEEVYRDPMCTKQALGENTLGYRVGKELAWSSFPALSIREGGSARLHSRQVTSAAGTPLSFVDVARGFWDTELNEVCQAIRLGDGTLRCLPLANYLSSDFADAKCTIPAAPTSLAEARYLTVASTTSLTIAALYKAVPHPGDVYRKDGSSCVSQARDGREWIKAGDAIPLDSLVEVTETSTP